MDKKFRLNLVKKILQTTIIKLFMNESEMRALPVGYCRATDTHILNIPFQGQQGQSVHYCGSTLPPAFNSIGRMLSVNFVTDESGSAKGFSARYRIACKFRVIDLSKLKKILNLKVKKFDTL